MNPHIHAASSAKRYGGTMEEYLDFHTFMDSSKAAFPDNRHRALTHNSWFIRTVIPRVFGNLITNSEGKTVSTAQLGEDHILEDHHGKWVPTAQDYLSKVPYEDWMGSTKHVSSCPDSHRKIMENQEKNKTTKYIDFVKG